ncbi:MAG: hypothetical protein V3T86_03045 [Planctomycetota bacterium]
MISSLAGTWSGKGVDRSLDMFAARLVVTAVAAGRGFSFAFTAVGEGDEVLYRHFGLVTDEAFAFVDDSGAPLRMLGAKSVTLESAKFVSAEVTLNLAHAGSTLEVQIQTTGAAGDQPFLTATMSRA